MLIESVMERLAEFQGKHSKGIVVVALIVTLFLGVGLLNIRMETDISKELPQDLPVIELQGRVEDTFGGQDIIFVVAQLDYGSRSKDAVRDIRDPRVMRMLLELEDRISEEMEIDRVQSIASVFKQIGIPDNVEGVKATLSRIPGSERAFNKDYSATLLYAYADLGTKEESIKDLDKKIREDIRESYRPPGVKVRLTGMPSIRVTMMDLLQSDALFTMSLSAFIILILLIIISRPWTRGILVFVPLLFGLIWTLGLMGWLNIPLSVATVGIGAMILGLGVEYGIFYVSRYEEERDKGNTQIDSLKTALQGVGSAIVGSSTTTIVGFLALLLASMPMMHHLGFTLALGIFCCVVSALVVNPAMILTKERVTHMFDVRKHEELTKRIEKRKII